MIISEDVLNLIMRLNTSKEERRERDRKRQRGRARGKERQTGAHFFRPSFEAIVTQLIAYTIFSDVIYKGFCWAAFVTLCRQS